MTKATASELNRLSEIDRADALLRAWVAAAEPRPWPHRWIRSGVADGEAFCMAMERDIDGQRIECAGFSSRGLLAAMIDCAARLEPGFRSAETLPAPADDEAPAVTIPAPAPTGVR